MQANPILLRDFEKSVLSQYGQDGMLEAIFERIGTHNKFFVEFGSNGRDDSGGNTAYLRRFGWSGLLLDRSATPYNEPSVKQYDVKIALVRADNINALFASHGVPAVFDLLSIDIDGQDFHVWNAIDDARYRPRVVVIESASHIRPPLDLVQKYDPYYSWDGSYNSGASPTALAALGKKKGYTLVGMTGPDLIFVETRLLQASGVTFLHQGDVETLHAMNKGAMQDFDQTYFHGKPYWNPSSIELKRDYARYRTYFEVINPFRRIALKIRYRLMALRQGGARPGQGT
jgi:hypothetical protein